MNDEGESSTWAKTVSGPLCRLAHRTAGRPQSSRPRRFLGRADTGSGHVSRPKRFAGHAEHSAAAAATEATAAAADATAARAAAEATAALPATLATCSAAAAAGQGLQLLRTHDQVTDRIHADRELLIRFVDSGDLQHFVFDHIGQRSGQLFEQQLEQVAELDSRVSCL